MTTTANHASPAGGAVISVTTAAAAGLVICICLLCVQRSEPVEYCLTESFSPRCPWNEVILVEKAQFGRMELGRCVTRNFGHVGCLADVLPQLDYACSGRTSCDFSVSDPSLVRTKPCPKDFTSYLDAVYRCVPVITAHRNNCRSGANDKQTISAERGYIVSNFVNSVAASSSLTVGVRQPAALSAISERTATSPQLTVPSSSPAPRASPYRTLSPMAAEGKDSSWAAPSCPLEFRLHKGQRINFTLLDFSFRNFTLSSGTSELGVGGSGEAWGGAGGGGVPRYGQRSTVDADSGPKSCNRMLIIEEPAVGNSITVCGGGGGGGLGSSVGRERLVYTSRSDLVRVLLLPANTAARYILKFEVSGCADPILPPDMHIKHQVDRLIAFCNKTGESFVLVCEDTMGVHGRGIGSERLAAERSVWKGELRNCTARQSVLRDKDITGEEQYKDLLGLPHVGISVAIILGVAMVTVVYVAIIMVCALHIRRWRKKVRCGTHKISTTNLYTTRGGVAGEHYVCGGGGPGGVIMTSPGSCRASQASVFNGYSERTPFFVKESISCTASGQKYSEFFELKSTGPEETRVTPFDDVTESPTKHQLQHYRHPLQHQCGSSNDVCGMITPPVSLRHQHRPNLIHNFTAASATLNSNARAASRLYSTFINPDRLYFPATTAVETDDTARTSLDTEGCEFRWDKAAGEDAKERTGAAYDTWSGFQHQVTPTSESVDERRYERSVGATGLGGRQVHVDSLVSLHGGSHVTTSPDVVLDGMSASSVID